MASDDDDEPDLMLVSTYFPVILATLKSAALVVGSETLQHVGVPVNVKVIAYVLSCYIDMNRQRTARFDRACGYTVACALALSMRDMHQPNACDGWTKTVELAVDSAWAVASSTWGTLACLGLQTLSNDVLVWGCSTMLAVHVALACTHMSTVELLLRVLFYMSMCAVMFFAKRQLRTLDRNAYMRGIPFVCSHMLVVGVYIAVPSLAVCMSLFVWSTYSFKECNSCESPEVKQVRCEPTSVNRGLSEEQRLVLQLRHAMESQ